MKKVLLYISAVSFCALLFACSEDSLQQKLEKEKDDRIAYVKDEGGFTQSTTGLYYKYTEKSDAKSTVLDTAVYLREKGMYPNLSVYMAFYTLKGDTISHNYLHGYFEPIEYVFGKTNLKPGLSEALGMMKEGDKLRTVMSTSLYGMGLPTLKYEPAYTGVYKSIVCDIELAKITTTTDPNLE